MKKRKNFLLAGLLCLLGLSPQAFAEVVSGPCGESVTYSFDTETGVLTISGTGNISRLPGEYYAPWHSFSESIREVVVEDGVGVPEYDWLNGCGLEQNIVANSTTLYYLSTGYFDNADNVTNDFPSGLRIIAPYACYNLGIPTDTLTIPEGYESIGDYAFYGAHFGEVLILPEGLKEIGARAFAANTAILKINIPESLESIGENCFNSYNVREPLYNSHTFFLYSNRIEEEGYTIPGNPTRIAPYAFYDAQRLKRLHVPASVEEIGLAAFRGSGLEEIELPEALSSIEAHAFNYCTNLLECTLPSNVQKIPDGLFFNCSKLQKVVLPEGIDSIGENAFSGCYQLREVNLPESVQYIAAPGFQDCVLLNAPLYTSTLFARLPTRRRDSYSVPEGIRVIAPYAFWRCDTITSGKILLPSSVEEIGSNAFSASTIDTIAIPERVKEIQPGTFSSCHSLRRVEFPAGLETISNYAFNNCSNLDSVSIPAQVDSIGDYAFANCTCLRTVTIERPQIAHLGTNIFENCPNLDLTLVLGDTYYRCADDATSCIVPEGIKHIAANAFQGCGQLQEVSLPASLQTIGDYAFAECVQLPSIDLPAQVKSIGIGAFQACTTLKDIVLPDSLTDISNYAFQNCYNLDSIRIPDPVTSIGAYAFSGCTSLSYVSLNKKLSNINRNAFEGCSNLSHIELPRMLQYISQEAFLDCESLTSIDLPASLSSVSESAFNGCANLTAIHIGSGNSRYYSYGGILYHNDDSYINVIIPQGITNIVIPSTMEQLPSGFTNKSTWERLTKVHSLTLPYAGRSKNATREYGILGYIFYNMEGNTHYEEKGSDGVTRSVDEYHYKIPANIKKLVLYCDTFHYQQIIYDRIYTSSINRYATDFSTLDTLEIHASQDIDATLFGERFQHLKSLLLDGSVTLPYYSFAGMDSLQTLTVTSATSMEEGCLGNLTGLRELTLPYAGAGSATTAANFGELFGSAADDRKQRVVQFHEDGTSTTYYIPMIERLTLTEGLTTIPYGAFYNCSMLRELTLPASLYMVAERALYGCAGLTDIYCQGAEPASAYSNTFEGVRVNSCVLHVPYNASDMYRRSTGWRDFYYIEEEAPIRIEVVKNIENAGVIYGLQEYQPGETAELQAVANSGYTFSGWTENGEMITEEATYTFTVEADRSLIAVFTPVSGSNDVKTTPGSNQVSFSWTAEEGASTYRLDVFTDEAMTQLAGSLLFDANGQIIKRAAATTLTATINGLSPLTDYYYRMTAYDETEQAISQYTGTFSTTEATGLDETAIEAARVEAIPGGIAIGHAAGQPVRIYTASGRPVAAFTAGSDYETVRLEKGLYLVTVGRKTCKVVL